LSRGLKTKGGKNPWDAQGRNFTLTGKGHKKISKKKRSSTQGPKKAGGKEKVRTRKYSYEGKKTEEQTATEDWKAYEGKKGERSTRQGCVKKEKEKGPPIDVPERPRYQKGRLRKEMGVRPSVAFRFRKAGKRKKGRIIQGGGTKKTSLLWFVSNMKRGVTWKNGEQKSVLRN